MMTSQALQGFVTLLGLFALDGQVEGFYTKGKLVHATALPTDGPGFRHLFLPRDRGWASESLADLVQQASEEIQTAFPDSGLLQIGDVAARGGGYISGHSSHQNGLDVDLAYLRTDLELQDPEEIDGFEQDFLQSDGTLDPAFDLERNFWLVRWWARTGVLNRIFVDARIKAALCQQAVSEGLALEEQEFLRRLRPWPHHSDHLHVRIACPEGNPKCVAQDEPPEGSGCDLAAKIASGASGWEPDLSEIDPAGGP